MGVWNFSAYHDLLSRVIFIEEDMIDILWEELDIILQALGELSQPSWNCRLGTNSRSAAHEAVTGLKKHSGWLGSGPALWGGLRRYYRG